MLPVAAFGFMIAEAKSTTGGAEDGEALLFTLGWFIAVWTVKAIRAVMARVHSVILMHMLHVVLLVLMVLFYGFTYVFGWVRFGGFRGDSSKDTGHGNACDDVSGYLVHDRSSLQAKDASLAELFFS